MADVCGIENVIWICELRRDVVEHVSYTQALEGEAGQEGEGFTRILKSSRRRSWGAVKSEGGSAKTSCAARAELSGTRGSGRSDRSRNAFSATLFGTFLEQLASQWIIFSNLIRGSDGSQVLRKDERLGGRGRGSSARCEWAEHACAHCAHRRRLTSRGSS